MTDQPIAQSPMKDVVIRLACPQDIETLCALYFQFHEFHVRGVPGRLVSLGELETFDRSELSASLATIIHRSDSALFVAQVAGECVGLAEVYVRQDESHLARVVYRYGHLQSLIVRADFRRHGIGARLVAAAEQWVREQGAAEMRLDSWEFAEGPLPFYTRQGYHTLRRTLVHQLEA